MTDIPEFHAEGSFVIKLSRGPVAIHTGPCPYDWHDRSNFKPGLPVIMDGVVRKIKAYEYFATIKGPRLGQQVGLMFEDEK
jgi:hypothetical protein